MNKVERTLTNSIVVTYPTVTQQLNISSAEYSLLQRMTNDKVGAIKFILNQYKLGLYESKQVVDTVQSFPSV